MDICVAIYERWTKEVDLNKLLDPDWEAKWNASRNAGANSTSAGGMSINFTEHLVNVSYARTAPSCASHFVSVTVVADYERSFNGYSFTPDTSFGPLVSATANGVYGEPSDDAATQREALPFSHVLEDADYLSTDADANAYVPFEPHMANYNESGISAPAPNAYSPAYYGRRLELRTTEKAVVADGIRDHEWYLHETNRGWDAELEERALALERKNAVEHALAAAREKTR
jgi:hypothetical protein